MYGVILICFRNMVLERFGESIWDRIREKAGVEDKFVNFEQQDDDVFFRLVEAAANLLGVDVDSVYYLHGAYWVIWLMRAGYDKLIRTLGNNLAEFIGNLDFMHNVYMRTMYPRMDAPSFLSETRQDGSLVLHYFSVRKGMDGWVSGAIKGVSRIIFRERIDMEVIEYSEEYHRGVRKDHWVFQLRFREDNLPPVGVDGNISPEEWMSILVNESEDSASLTKEENSYILAKRKSLHYTAKIPAKILIDPLTFCHAFPYHVVFDKRLVILHCGVKVQQLCPRVTEEGAKFEEFLSIKHPHIALTIKSLRSFLRSVFVLTFIKKELKREMQDKPTISLRGQMIWMDTEKKMIFLGSPLLTKLEDLTERGLHLSDIAPHDLTRDLILFNQQRIAEVELSKQLEQKKEELRLLMRDLAEEKKKTDTLLYSMLPREVANELREGRNVTAEEFPEVTILFSDIVHFTDMCSQCQPIQIVRLLNSIYTRFDQLTTILDVYKVETIGDAYMVVGGLRVEADSHAQRVARFGLKQLSISREVLSPVNGEPIQIRIGIHTGPVVAGVVGLKMPRYCLFGDTVNTASRMESTGVPGKVHASEAVVRALKNKDQQFIFSPRGDVEVKGKGKMRTYFLCGVENCKNSCTTTDRMIEDYRPRSLGTTQTPADSAAPWQNYSNRHNSTVALSTSNASTPCPVRVDGAASKIPAPTAPPAEDGANASRITSTAPSKICMIL